MKILCVIDNLGPGGAQRQLVGLAIGFKENGHDVSFLVYHEYNFFKNLLDEAIIPVHYISVSSYFKRLIKMRKYIRSGKYDAVLSFMEASNFICEVSGFPFRKWKLIVGERSAKPEISKSPKLVLFRWVHFFADFVVANSYANIKIVQSVNPLLPKSKCKVIYNIVDFNNWKHSCDYLPRKNGKLKLLVIASHRYVKNLNGLIDALKLLDNFERSRIIIEWYGDKVTEPYNDASFPEAKQKIDILKLNDIITFLPATKEITKKIQMADAVGLFSYYEGLPNTICEGLACGKPIICSAVSDLPSLLSHEPNLLCNPADAQSIADSLKYLISLRNDQLMQIGAKNMAIAKKNLDKKILLDKYLKLLQ